MIHQLNKVLSMLCILAWSAVPAQAQPVPAQEPCEPCRCELREWDDRCEGVLDKVQVSGASFELRSVHYLRTEALAAGSEQLHLSFWLPEPAELDEITVWHPRGPLPDYRMEPRKKQYPEGRQDFAWPRAEVIDPLGLSSDALFTLIKAGTVYFPAQLSTGEGPPPTAGYAFVFHAGAPIDAACTIADEGAQVVRSFQCFEDQGTIVIEWDGRDKRGQPVPEGVYALKFAGYMLAETLRPLPYSVTFWHRAPLE